MSGQKRLVGLRWKVIVITLAAMLSFSLLPPSAVFSLRANDTSPSNLVHVPPTISSPTIGNIWNGTKTITWTGNKDIEDGWTVYCDFDGIEPYNYNLATNLYVSQSYPQYTLVWNTPTVPNGYWYIVVLETGIYSSGAMPGISGQFRVDNSDSPNIRINSNSDFNAAHGVTGGTGSVQEPWIIENRVINGTGFGYCIYVGNTTDRFIVKNCTLFDANGGVNSPYYSNSGLVLYNVQNGKIIDNIITRNYDGIYLNSSCNNILARNYIYSQKSRGLYLAYSDNNTMLNNTFTANPQGAYITYSDFNTVIANNVSNAQNGVLLSSALNMTLHNNTFTNCGIFITGTSVPYWNSHTINNYNTVDGKPVYYFSNMKSGAIPLGTGAAILANCSDMIIENQDVCFGTIGIEVGFSSNISITNVNASANYIGMGIYYSDNVTITNVSALLNKNSGIILDAVNKSKVTNVTAKSNVEYGLLLNKCNYNLINNCTSNNNKNGFASTYSANNSFRDNTAKSNQNSGIYIARSTFSTIVNSTTNGNNININSQYSDYNKFLKNNVSNTGNTGMYLSYSKYNIISQNIAIGNSRDGIKLAYGCYYNSVTENYVKSNSAGIYLDYAQRNIVRNNTATSNGGAGLYLFVSKDNEITNNTITYNNRGIQIGSSSSSYQQTNIISYNRIKNNSYGIQSDYSCKNNISNNLFINNTNGIYLIASDQNQIKNNSISHVGSGYGIRLYYTCDYNTVVSNVVSNYWYGIVLMTTCHYNVLSSNSVKENDGGGIWIVDNSQYNKVYHNNVINNINQAKDDCINNQWDNGYPSGGNYWSDYSGTDIWSGPYQNISGSDNIGDTPYTTIMGSAGARDKYPLMTIWTPQPPSFLNSIKIPVVLGWNLISVPLNIPSLTLPAQLLDGDTMWNRVMWYDPITAQDHWKQFNKAWSLTLNDLSRIDMSMGFWINITDVGDGYLSLSGNLPTSTQIQLRAGWNLVGYPTLCTNMTVGIAFWGTGADIVEVFNQTAPYRTKVAGSKYLMKPGEGYWVHVPADTIWTVDW
jgi:parallel beta-helix repeat protein